MSISSKLELEELCRKLRREILEMAVRAGGGHIAPSLSVVEILVALYWGGFISELPGSPRWGERNRVILSKGHAALALYTVLAERGFFPSCWLKDYGRPGCHLGGMVEYGVPGVEASTGSLGHGLSVGVGLALAARMQGQGWNTYVILGDGECQEGSVWEAIAAAGHHRLGNLVAIIDRNQLQALERTEAVISLSPLNQRFRDFGWRSEVVDGHNVVHLQSALGLDREQERPTAIIAYTTKGKGISYMEDQPLWHWRVPEGNELEQARRELA